LISGNQSDSIAEEVVAIDFDERGGLRCTAMKKLEVESDEQI